MNAAKSKGIRPLIILVCWVIWWEQNTRIFYGKEKPSARLLSEVQYEARLWAQAGAKHLSKIVVTMISE
jgi:hypothetical protein